MVVSKKLFALLLGICAAALLPICISACGSGSSSETLSLEAGDALEVAETTRLSELTIGQNATITAPEGSTVTLTVDGVETPITPGTYTGDVVITPAESIVVEFGGMGAGEIYNYRAAIDVEDGTYRPERSVEAAVVGGEVTDTAATDVTITSVNENFNGIIVKGDTEFTYTITNPVINFTGNGGNDFAGYGAAIMASGKADVTVNNPKITSHGAVRTAVFAGGDSTIHVNDADIEVFNGTLPADYEFSVAPGKMKEVPWMLGITGNLRATNIADNANAYYTNSHIKAQGWGCLSSDNVSDTPKIFATNCLIETTESGYGAFSLGTTVCTFRECTFNVTDMALISQDGDSLFTDGTVVNSDRFGVMYWGSDAYVTIDKGSVFNTESATILLKGGATKVSVDNAELNPKNGIILQMMANDDPNQMGGGMPGGGMPGGTGGDMPQGGMPEGGMPQGGMQGGGMPEGGMPQGGGMPSGDMAQGGMPPSNGMPGDTGGSGGGGAPGGSSGNTSKDVDAVFSNMTLAGDMVNGNTAAGALSVSLDNVTYTGAISTATVTHALGPNGEEITMEHPELYYLIGEVTNTYCATEEEFGVSVTLDGATQWTVDKTAYLTGLTISDGATISAPEGHRLAMTVNGASKPVKPGTYEGEIVLTVSGI
jgi:hypothetical protein